MVAASWSFSTLRCIWQFVAALDATQLDATQLADVVQGGQSPSKGKEGKRAFRRSSSVPDLADRSSRSPRRRRDKYVLLLSQLSRLPHFKHDNS